MKVIIAKGLIFLEDYKVAGAQAADLVAHANGEFYAERFVERYTGKVLHLDRDLKVFMVGDITEEDIYKIGR